MRKIPARYRMIVFVFLMTVFIGLILSGIMTFRTQGLSPDFVRRWHTTFINTWIVVVPTVVVVLPIVNAITNKVVAPQK